MLCTIHQEGELHQAYIAYKVNGGETCIMPESIYNDKVDQQVSIIERGLREVGTSDSKTM